METRVVYKTEEGEVGKVLMTFWVYPSQRERIRREAKKLGRSISSHIRQCLGVERYISLEEKP